MIWRAFVLAIGLAAQAVAQDQKPMARDAHPSLEVAAIKLSDPTSTRQGIGTEGRRIRLTGETVTSMMMFAYAVHKDQIVAGPGWRSDEKYDVSGLADKEGEPDVLQMQEIVRNLLTDRFGLTLHRDKREMTYYAIIVTKGGPRLTKSKLPPDEGTDQTGNGGKSGMDMKFTNNTMPNLALGLQYYADKPVVDETGLPGGYDFSLKWLPDSLASGEGDQAPVLFTAIQEQLGLKLEPKKGLVEVLVIDRLERPSGN